MTDNVVIFRTPAQRRADEYQKRADEEAAERRRRLAGELAAIASIRNPRPFESIN